MARGAKIRRREYPVYRGTEAITFLVRSGLLWYVNKVVCHVLGFKLLLDEARNEIVIEDHRGYPNTVFAPQIFEDGRSRFHTYMRERGNDVMRYRKEILGFIIQESSAPRASTSPSKSRTA